VEHVVDDLAGEKHSLEVALALDPCALRCDRRGDMLC
jgi:hypothetical protein